MRGCQSCPVNVRFWGLVRLGHRHFCRWALSLPLSFFVGLFAPGSARSHCREGSRKAKSKSKATRGSPRQHFKHAEVLCRFCAIGPQTLEQAQSECVWVHDNTCAAAASFKLCRFLRIFDFRQKAILLAHNPMWKHDVNDHESWSTCEGVVSGNDLCHGQGWVATLQMHAWQSSERSNYGHNPQSWKATVRNHTFCTPRIEQHLQILFSSNRAKKTLKPVSPRDQGVYTVYTLKS